MLQKPESNQLVWDAFVRAHNSSYTVPLKQVLAAGMDWHTLNKFR